MTGHQDEGGYFTFTDFLKVTGKGPEVEYIRHYLRHHPKVTEQGPEVEYLRHHSKVTEQGPEVEYLRHLLKVIGNVPEVEHFRHHPKVIGKEALCRKRPADYIFQAPSQGH